MNETLIPLAQIIDNPYQPRTTDDAEHIEKLARSIAADGLLQPPTARLHSNGKGDQYQLAFGHSRRKAFEWLAANWEKKQLLERYHGYSAMPLEVAHLSDEEMYRQAITENVQRRDLAPTELARAMQKYMDEFNADSKQTAALFGVNDATVRGVVRFLDLPEPAQKALDEGKISQNTARSLLSMQKVAPEAVVVQAVKEIEKRDGTEMPEDVIEHLIDRQNTVVEMWPSHRDGKPRAGHNLWALDMKNFPNASLPALDKDELVKAFGLSGQLKSLVEGWAGNLLTGFDNANMQHAQEIDPDLVGKLKVLTNPPACAACDFHTVISGNHYCGVKLCHERKSAAWMKYKVEQASKQLKIDLYRESDGGFRVLDYQDGELFQKRHAGLRLIEKSRFSGYHYQGFTGVDSDLFYVVATGDALNKIARSNKGTNGGKKTEKEKAEARAMKLYRTRRKEFLWEYTAIAQTIFENVPLDVVEKLIDWKFVGIDDQIPEELKPEGRSKGDTQAEFQRRKLVWSLLIGRISLSQRNKLTGLLEKFQEFTKVKTPRAFTKRVEEWDAEIAETAKVVKAVAAETKKRKD